MSGTASITVVQVPPASVVIEPRRDSVLVGGTLQLTAIVRDASGAELPDREVTWTSLDPEVATIKGGLIAGVNPGTAKIRATADGVSGEAEVRVRLMRIFGTVRTPPAEHSLPVSKARVELYVPGEIPVPPTVGPRERILASTTTAPDGTYSIEGWLG